MACGTPHDLGIAPGSLDLITLWSVLAHIADPREHMEMLFDLLKPGGKLLIYTVNADSLLRKAGPVTGAASPAITSSFGVNRHSIVC